MMELSFSEECLILVLRNFDFLRHEGYLIDGIVVYGREPFILFKSKAYSREILIQWACHSEINVSFYNTAFLVFRNKKITIEQLASYFGFTFSNTLNIEHSVYEKAKFCKMQLLEVVKGKMWLNI